MGCCTSTVYRDYRNAGAPNEIWYGATRNTLQWLQNDPEGQSVFARMYRDTDNEACNMAKHLSAKQSEFLRTLGLDPNAIPGMYLGISHGPHMFVLAAPVKVEFSGDTVSGEYLDMSTPTRKCTMDVYSLTVEGESHLEICGALHAPPPPAARPKSIPLWSFFKSDCESVIGPIDEADPRVPKNSMIFHGVVHLATSHQHHASSAPATATSCRSAAPSSQLNTSLLANQVERFV